MVEFNGTNGIAIFSSARSGTTLLIDYLCSSLRRMSPGITIINPGEILDPSQAYDANWNSYWIDKNEILDRPITNAADIWRMERLFEQADSGHGFPIIKLFGNDIAVQSWPLIRDRIIKDRTWLVISLVRSDIANMMYSAALGRAINRWERRKGGILERTSDPYEIPERIYTALGQAILRTIDWHLFHTDRINQVIWYDQLESGDLEIPQLGLSKTDFSAYLETDSALQKVNMDHEADVRTYITNHEELISFSRKLERDCHAAIKAMKGEI